MENTDKKMCGENCCCNKHGMYGGAWHSSNRLIVTILRIIVIILIFWCGFRLGEITGSIRGSYGHEGISRSRFGMMDGYNYDYSAGTPKVNNSTVVTPPVK